MSHVELEELLPLLGALLRDENVMEDSVLENAKARAAELAACDEFIFTDLLALEYEEEGTILELEDLLPSLKKLIQHLNQQEGVINLNTNDFGKSHDISLKCRFSAESSEMTVTDPILPKDRDSECIELKVSSSSSDDVGKPSATSSAHEQTSEGPNISLSNLNVSALFNPVLLASSTPTLDKRLNQPETQTDCIGGYNTSENLITPQLEIIPEEVSNILHEKALSITPSSTLPIKRGSLDEKPSSVIDAKKCLEYADNDTYTIEELSSNDVKDFHQNIEGSLLKVIPIIQCQQSAALKLISSYSSQFDDEYSESQGEDFSLGTQIHFTKKGFSYGSSGSYQMISTQNTGESICHSINTTSTCVITASASTTHATEFSSSHEIASISNESLSNVVIPSVQKPIVFSPPHIIRKDMSKHSKMSASLKSSNDGKNPQTVKKQVRFDEAAIIQSEKPMKGAMTNQQTVNSIATQNDSDNFSPRRTRSRSNTLPFRSLSINNIPPKKAKVAKCYDKANEMSSDDTLDGIFNYPSIDDLPPATKAQQVTNKNKSIEPSQENRIEETMKENKSNIVEKIILDDTSIISLENEPTQRSCTPTIDVNANKDKLALVPYSIQNDISLPLAEKVKALISETYYKKTGRSIEEDKLFAVKKQKASKSKKQMKVNVTDAELGTVKLQEIKATINEVMSNGFKEILEFFKTNKPVVRQSTRKIIKHKISEKSKIIRKRRRIIRKDVSTQIEEDQFIPVDIKHTQSVGIQFPETSAPVEIIIADDSLPIKERVRASGKKKKAEDETIPEPAEKKKKLRPRKNSLDQKLQIKLPTRKQQKSTQMTLTQCLGNKAAIDDSQEVKRARDEKRAYKDYSTEFIENLMGYRAPTENSLNITGASIEFLPTQFNQSLDDLRISQFIRENDMMMRHASPKDDLVNILQDFNLTNTNGSLNNHNSSPSILTRRSKPKKVPQIISFYSNPSEATNISVMNKSYLEDMYYDPRDRLLKKLLKIVRNPENQLSKLYDKPRYFMANTWNAIYDEHLRISDEDTDDDFITSTATTNIPPKECRSYCFEECLSPIKY